ncbi:unnamed protein product [Ceutorhynchus assimilis]|uniref:Uncharacterized protein n=1 Tax=Ceutorhynchus assimilis TaxID=467358 RepID=A0A9N9QIX5_9CUCU|nr:unnamed protein product [Ceutorhynchus assimilis]
MFSGKKKEKKEISTTKGTSSFHQTTTVKKSDHGTTVTKTTQITSLSACTQSSTREERSHSFSTTGSFGFDGTASISGPNASSYQSPYFNRTYSLYGSKVTPSVDASPFTPTRLETTGSSSFLANRSGTATASSPIVSFSSALPLNRLNYTGGYTSPYNRGAYGGSHSTLAVPNQTSSATAKTNNAVPTYKNQNVKLGKALLINNVKFIETKDERQGAKKDSEDFGKFLKKINFDVDHKLNMKGKDMLKKVKDFSKSDFSRHDISLVVIMSHGNNLIKSGERIRGGFTQIAGTDNEPVSTEDIIEQFVATSSHPSLRGKPKIFIFQCCRGEKDQEICHDAAPIGKQLKEYSDILVAYSTLPGYLSNRDPKSGTWYIQSICDVFQKHYKDHHIEEMLKIVDHQLSLKHPKFTQTSTYESRGFKQCFLCKN